MKKISRITDAIKNVKEHVVMRELANFKVGGVADYFYEAKTINELVEAVKSSRELDLPYFILGNGSNILFSDYGFPGLVIKNSTSNIAVMKEKSQVIVDSGVMLSKLIVTAISSDLAGLEFLWGVPGTVGGAAYGNAGAFGYSIGDYIRNVTLLITDPESKAPKIVQYARDWFSFSYRSTKLKKMKSKTKPVILSIKFQLSQNQKDEIMHRINTYQKLRHETQPIGKSAGCIFKNPIPPELKNITGDGTKGMPELPEERRAGFLLDKSGVKRIRIGEAEVSDKHANFIINRGNAKATEIRTLIEKMRSAVETNFGITLEEEIEYIGQW